MFNMFVICGVASFKLTVLNLLQRNRMREHFWYVLTTSINIGYLSAIKENGNEKQRNN